MEISKLTTNKGVKKTPSILSKKMDKGFAQEFDSAAKKEKESQLGHMLNNIKRKGKQIIETRNISVVHEYKDNIKEYLSLVLKDAYRIEKLRSIYNGNPSTLVEIINEELNHLAQAVLVQEKDTISVVNMIEHIEGLLIDTYK